MLSCVNSMHSISNHLFYLACDCVLISSIQSFCLLNHPEKYVFKLDVPQTAVVSVSPSGEVVEGSSVTLSCTSEANPPAVITWFKNHEDEALSSSGESQLVFHSIQTSDTGEYVCRAENHIGETSASTNITVKCE